MATVQMLKKKVEKLEQVLAPKHKDIVVILSFGPHDKPHGKYRYRKLHIFEEYRQPGTNGYEACTEEEELELLRATFEDIQKSDFDRTRAPYWATWENFLEYHRCKCGKHE